MRAKILTFIAFFLFFSPIIYSYEDTLTDYRIQGSLENSRLREIFERYIATILMYDPERATELGIHDSDHLLTKRSPENFNEELKSLTKIRQDLKLIDRETLYPYLKVDANLLDSMLEVDIYNLSNLNILAKYPQYYLKPLEVIYKLMNKETGNYNLKATNSIKRLKLFPDNLLQAERNISHPPKIWTEYAIDIAQKAKENIPEFFVLFKDYVKFDPTTKADLDKTMDKVKYALDKFIEYLKTDVMRKADGDPAVGEFTYGFYLERWHGLDMTTSSAWRYVKKNFKEKMKDLEKEAENLNPVVASKEGWEGVLKNISKEHPPLSELVKTFSQEVNRASNHFDEYKVVNFPKQRLLIKKLPAFLEPTLPYAVYIPPFPFDDEKVAEVYLYMPDEKEGKETIEKKLSLMYTYNNIELLVSALVVPGMHLKYYESYKNYSRIRKMANQPVINNGWLCYAELLSEEMGYYSSMQQAMFLRKYLLAIRAARAYVDVGFHTKKLSYEESVDFFVKNLKFSQSQAKKEVLKISLEPSISLSYVIGMDKILEMRRKYKKTENKYFDLRSFHSDFLQLGNIQIENAVSELRRMRKKDKGELDE